jgi:subtilisin-like proprotein convertase family protein
MKTTLNVICVFLLVNFGFSQGNTCATATLITPAATCTYTAGTTVGANYQNNAANGGTPTCASPGAPDVWYVFTATASGNYTIDTQTGTITDGGMSIYSGACGSLTQLACDDDSSPNGLMPMITTALTAGQTYYIRFWAYGGTATGTFSICVTTPPAAPSNDNCVTSTVVTQQPNGSCTTVTGTVAGATSSGIANCTGTADDDVWYSFTATNTTAIINRTTTGSWDSGIEIFASTGPAPGSCIGVSLGCQDSEASFTVSGLTVGMNYYVRVYSWSTAFTPSNPTFTFCVTSPPTLPPGSIVMTNGSTTACSGTFYDMGGLTDYSNSTTQVFTICPTVAGNKVQAIFTSFTTENSLDFLEIFDGNSVAAPSLGAYSGSNSPGTVQATNSNASGCLTFRFTSDGSAAFAGWVATLSCIVPCQTITSNFVSSNEAPGVDGVIRLCQGQSVNLVGSGTFSSSSAGATYQWSMGNGATVNGANINYTYPAVGSYSVNLTITDPNGCTNSNSINRNIQVSTTPTIGTSATPATLCTNQVSALNANVTMTPFTVNCTPPVSGTTFLPDGSGVSYQTAITTNCYNPTQTVTQASDFNNVCLTMEHSFLGDLQIELICPNGQSMILKSYAQGGSGTYLGSPIDDLTSGPGTGRTYCFTPTATTFLVSGVTSSAGTPAGNSIVAGNYMPTQSFTNLIGCPLNGSWTIRVTDNLAADDGYIFNWDVNFNAALTAASSFTPTIVSQGWVPATNLTSTSATTANVIPTITGNQCFTYSLTDNFGCTYTQPQCINVNCTALPVGLLSFDATAISNDRVQLVWETATEQNNDFFLIERSSNGLDNWEFVSHVNGAGNSNSPRNYMTFDEAPLDGISYYRLSQFDFDGTHFVADLQTVLIDRNSETGIEVFPNPSTGLVRVKSDLVSLSILKITDASGKNVTALVKVIPQSDASVTLDMRGLSNGIYTIKAGDKTTRVILE